MDDDRITIDPEFDPGPSREPGRYTTWLMASVVAVSAFILGSVLQSPAPVEPAELENAASATTASDNKAPSSTIPTTDPVDSTIPRALSVREMVSLPMPLSDAVPGFTDTVVLLETPDPGFNVFRWRASDRATELALSVARAGAWPVGLDASGTLFARVSQDGSLIVTQIPDIGVDPPESEWEGLDVVGVLWHETRSGALVLLSCPLTQPGVATIHTLEVSDAASRPLLLRSFDESCGSEEENIWLERWDDEGVWIGQAALGLDTRILIDADGSETAFDSGLPGAIDTFQVDGVLGEVSYSPDGSLVALVSYDDPYSANGIIRVVSSKSGVMLAEMTEPGSEVFALRWSTDGRFLIFHQWNPDTGSATLVFYNTSTNSITTIPILDVVDEIRTAPAS